MAFNIAEAFGDALRESAKEQISYIPLEKLDPDPDNFYSLDGLDDLAGNIELIGLQQPLRVRPGTEGRYTVISGHRRRAAIMLIRDSGSSQFAEGVPCIVERGVQSEAMRELRLIYANASTRVMTSAEISKQAERVETLLYQLKEEGVEFPGRMRDHVAEACNVSKTKLARLHAIRNNLIPDLLAYFDDGQLPESTAYELSRMPGDAQEAIAESAKRSKGVSWISGDGARYAMQHAKEYMEARTCKEGEAGCEHHAQRFLQAVRAGYSWQRCSGGCCLKCHDWDTCGYACARCKEKQKKAKEEKTKENAAEKQRAAEREAERQKNIRESRQAQALRVLPLLEKAGLADDAKLPSGYYNGSTPVSLYREQAAGNFDGGHWYDDRLLPTDKDRLIEMAGMLDTSVDYLIGLTDDPRPAEARETVSESDTGPKWETGKPKEISDHDYVVVYGISNQEDPRTSSMKIMRWNGFEFVNAKSHVAQLEGMKIYRWFRLPEV